MGLFLDSQFCSIDLCLSLHHYCCYSCISLQMKHLSHLILFYQNYFSYSGSFAFLYINTFWNNLEIYTNNFQNFDKNLGDLIFLLCRDFQSVNMAYLSIPQNFFEFLQQHRLVVSKQILCLLRFKSKYVTFILNNFICMSQYIVTLHI